MSDTKAPVQAKRLLLERMWHDVDPDYDLPSTVAAALANGASWRGLALKVSEATGIPVSHEALRQWYGGDASP